MVHPRTSFPSVSGECQLGPQRWTQKRCVRWLPPSYVSVPTGSGGGVMPASFLISLLRTECGAPRGFIFFRQLCQFGVFNCGIFFFFLITVFYYCFFPPLSSSIPIQITDSCCFRRLSKLFGRSPNHQHGGLSHSGVSLEAVMRIFFSVKTNENNMCQELCKSSL